MSVDDGGAAAEAVTSAAAQHRATVVATLIRVTGDWDLAEDVVQDAIETALRRWPVEGIPRSTAGWLTTVARNRALDILRRRQNERSKLQEVALMAETGPGQVGADGLDDDRLRLIFTCCHPALALDSRVALTLKVAAGLSTGEIAAAFLVSESTLSQRLLRTKQKIAHAAIPYRVPPPELLDERTSGVLGVVYLIFNAGYGQVDDHVAVEAQRLARLVVDLMPEHDEARGLLALITLQLARRATRFDDDGELVPMEEQDRSRWDLAAVDDGIAQLRRSAAPGRPPGPYRLQAAIAACHASARDAESTDWGAVAVLYDALMEAQPSPVVALNRAVAIGFRDGFEAGLAALDALPQGELARYYLLPAAHADFLRRLGRAAEAAAAYREAIVLAAPDSPERRLLTRRLGEVSG